MINLHMKKPSIDEMRFHSKIIYNTILVTCIVIFGMFSYVGYLTYDLTRNSAYTFISIIVFLPVIVAIFLTLIMIYTGKTKFYNEVKKEELELYQKLK